MPWQWWWCLVLLANSALLPSAHALRLPEWVAPAAMPVRDAFIDSDSQTVVLPLRSAAYPVITVGVGIPHRDIAFELRWDIGVRDGIGVNFISMLSMVSDTITADSQSELLRFGSTYAMRLPIYPMAAPTPFSRNDGAVCVGNDPFGEIHFASQGWLDMSATSPLWTHWNSYSLSSERLILGAYRPPDGWRSYEMHVERANYFNVTLELRHPLLTGATTATPSPPSPPPKLFRLRFDLSCDYSYIPLSALRVLWDTAVTNQSNATTTTTSSSSSSSMSSSTLMLTRALSLLTGVDTARLTMCFVGQPLPSHRRHHHHHHRDRAASLDNNNNDRLCFALTDVASERQALRVNRISDVDIVLGRRHARHFLIGRDIVRNATSALLLDALVPHIDEQDYFWLGIVGTAIAAVWYFGVYVGAYREQLASELFAQFGATIDSSSIASGGSGNNNGGDDDDNDVMGNVLARRYARAYGDQRSLFYLGNRHLLNALVSHTRIVLLLSLGVAVFGFRLDNAIYLDLPRAYVRALVFVVTTLCALHLAHTPSGHSPVQTTRLAISMSNAALLVVWLVFSVHTHRFINALVMVGTAYMLTLRTGQTLLEHMARWHQVGHIWWSEWWRWWRQRHRRQQQHRSASTTTTTTSITQRRWALVTLIVHTVEALISWAAVAWLFNGFSVPFLMDIWLTTAPFKLELLMVSLLFITFFMPIYLYCRAAIVQVSEANHLVAHIVRTRIKLLAPIFRAATSGSGGGGDGPPPSAPRLMMSSLGATTSLPSPSSSPSPSAILTTLPPSPTRNIIVQRHPISRRDTLLE